MDRMLIKVKMDLNYNVAVFSCCSISVLFIFYEMNILLFIIGE